MEDRSPLITFSNITIFFPSPRSVPLNCFPGVYSSLYIRESGAENPWEINTTGKLMCKGGEEGVIDEERSIKATSLSIQFLNNENSTTSSFNFYVNFHFVNFPSSLSHSPNSHMLTNNTSSRPSTPSPTNNTHKLYPSVHYISHNEKIKSTIFT
jgi:hypothetical protein